MIGEGGLAGSRGRRLRCAIVRVLRRRGRLCERSDVELGPDDPRTGARDDGDGCDDELMLGEKIAKTSTTASMKLGTV